MAKVIGVLVCLLIVVLDIVAGILGIEAEIAQDKVYHFFFFLLELEFKKFSL